MKNVFYFTADWCGPCKKVRPVVEDMIREGFHIQIIDVDIEKELKHYKSQFLKCLLTPIYTQLVAYIQ